MERLWRCHLTCDFASLSSKLHTPVGWGCLDFLSWLIPKTLAYRSQHLYHIVSQQKGSNVYRNMWWNCSLGMLDANWARWWQFPAEWIEARAWQWWGKEPDAQVLQWEILCGQSAATFDTPCGWLHGLLQDATLGGRSDEDFPGERLRGGAGGFEHFAMQRSVADLPATCWRNRSTRSKREQSSR